MFRHSAPVSYPQKPEGNPHSTVTIDLNSLGTASLLGLKAFLVENELFAQAQLLKDFIDKKKE